ncbi:MAG: hypothetical protein ABSG53_18115 [Thermoguttaceae bacterium]
MLLVGDATLLPVRYMMLDRLTPAAFDTAFYPSDLYYSDARRPSAQPPTEQAIVGLLNSGVDLIVHIGHGSGGWRGCLYPHDLGKINNAGHLPVRPPALFCSARKRGQRWWAAKAHSSPTCW